MEVCFESSLCNKSPPPRLPPPSLAIETEGGGERSQNLGKNEVTPLNGAMCSQHLAYLVAI